MVNLIPPGVRVMRSGNMVPPMSKADLKRMKAREHNRAYLAGELEKKDDLFDFVKAVAQGFQSVVETK